MYGHTPQTSMEHACISSNCHISSSKIMTTLIASEQLSYRLLLEICFFCQIVYFFLLYVFCQSFALPQLGPAATEKSQFSNHT